MQSEVITTTKIVLELTEEEALWLRDIMQNPLGMEDDNESKTDKEMRKAFFDALSLP